MTQREWKCTDAHPNSPPLGKNHNGFKDLTHTNMCYRCDYCDQGYNNIYWLAQIGLQFFICHKCQDYYKLSWEDQLKLRYVETMEEWRETDVSIWFPTPVGFVT